eukprot:355686_1
MTYLAETELFRLHTTVESNKLSNIHTTELLIAIICISSCCIVAACIISHSIYQLFILDSTSWINKTYRNLTIIIMIMFALSSVSDLVHTVLRYMIPNISNHA